MIHIIGEAATNHFGSVENAKKLVDIAVECGVDSIKLQLIHNSEVYLPGKYEYGSYDIQNVRELRKKSKLSQKNLKLLDKYAKDKGIQLTAAPFGEKALEDLMSINPPYIKIASGDMNNLKLVSVYAEMKKKLIISTGMSSLSDVKILVNHLEKIGFDDYVLMHCVAIYPHNEIDSQLGYIDILKNEFDCKVGFSDHTMGVAAASAAIALGVEYLEKHYTIDRKMGGLDAKHSLEPNELKRYVETVRGVYDSIKSSDRILSDDELYTRKRARRGIYSSRKIRQGETIKENDLVFLRPESEIPVNLHHTLIGKIANHDIDEYSAIKKDMLNGS